MPGKKGSETAGREMPTRFSESLSRALPARARRRKRSRFGWILVLVALVQCNRPVEVGQKAPDFVLSDLKGASVSLEALRGQWVFLHFWATWCPPCLVELPALMRFVEGLEGETCTLLAVCVDDQPPARIRAFLRSWGAEVPVYLDPGGSLAKQYGTFRFPETYVLDPEGKLCSKVIGAGEWKISEWARILHTCAAKPSGVRRGEDAGS